MLKKYSKLRTAGYPYTDPFGLFETVQGITKPEQLQADEVLLLWGGMDISPELYDEQCNQYCHQHEPSTRDKEELALLKRATELDVPIIGICRGAQLLTVFTGGTLVQHGEKHNGRHAIVLHDEEDREIHCNSAHHQICQPVQPAEILASAGPTVGYDQFNKKQTIDLVPEVIHFPQINALGIQYHPEWSDCGHEATKYASDSVRYYLFGEQVCTTTA